MASSSTTPTVHFARGVLSIIDLWPALRLAVAEEWGGPDSGAKRTWIASSVVDLFEESLTTIAEERTPPIDLDDLADMLFGMVSDEFDADLEDNSAEAVASDVLKLWDSIVGGSIDMVEELERLVEANKGKKMDAIRSHEEDSESGSESGSGSEDEEEDEAMDVDEQPPTLVESQDKKKEEPVVDEDGFTLVQGKGKGKGKK